MGISDPAGDADLWARVTKSLLRMDQFRMVPGGNGTTRTIQQHLNRRYVDSIRIPAMNMVPTDGHYSRDVQQGLMLAVQYELGLDKNTINGYFGPGTKQALKTVGSGRLGNYLEYLFRAACWFNSPTYGGSSGQEAVGYPTPNLANPTVDIGHTQWLGTFQKFAQIPVTKTNDYTTWAQLLISSGDTSRNAEGADCITEITPARAKLLYKNGYRIVGRYLDEHIDPGSPDYLGKALKPGELSTILDAGLRLFPLFQYNGTQLFNFTEAKGYAQGSTAHFKSKEYGIPDGACIYFSVDYDAQDHHISSNIIPYFKGVKKALEDRGGDYAFGVYGTRNVCARVSEATGAKWSFVSGMSWGYSGNLGYPLPKNWSFNQILEYNFQSDWGLDHNIWRNNSDRGVSSKQQPKKYSAEAIVEFVRKLEDAAADYRGVGPGSSGKQSVRQLVPQFFRQDSNYQGASWAALTFPLNKVWLGHCRDAGLTLKDQYKNLTDPATGVTLSFQHIMAGLEGHLVHHTNPDSNRSDTGDMFGWGGDLAQFYQNWRTANAESTVSGKKFVEQNFAKTSVYSYFMDANLKEDADVFHLFHFLDKYPSMKISEALWAIYVQGEPNNADRQFVHQRMTHFYERRFGGSKSSLRSILKDALTGEWWQITSLVEMILLDGVKGNKIPDGEMPEEIPASDLNEFVNAIADDIISRVGRES
ncbi:glycoside hydrolase domain-containing protein [Streptomyces sp. O3]